MAGKKKDRHPGRMTVGIPLGVGTQESMKIVSGSYSAMTKRSRYRRLSLRASRSARERE